jgi:heterodisulfide reductase subunit B
MSGNEMMKYALLRCCTTPIYLEQYESSTDAVLGKLGVEFVDIKEFNCCGYPFLQPEIWRWLKRKAST